MSDPQNPSRSAAAFASGGTPSAAAGAGRPPLRLIPVRCISPDPYQSRTRPDHAALSLLAESIAAQGLLQPVWLRPHPEAPEQYWVFAGGRRVEALRLLLERDDETEQWSTIPAYVAEGLSDSEALLRSLTENLQRESLTPVEQGEAMLRLMEREGWNQKELAGALQRDYSYCRQVVAGTRHVLASPELQALDRESQLPFRVLARLPRERELQVPFVRSYLAGQRQGERDSRAALEHLRRGDSRPEAPEGESTRLVRLQRFGRDLEALLGEPFWDASLTPAEWSVVELLRERLPRLGERLGRLIAPANAPGETGIPLMRDPEVAPGSDQ